MILAGLWLFGRGLPDYAYLKDYKPSEVTRIYDLNHAVVREIAVQRRIFMPYAQIPLMLRNAFISAEDKNFFDHNGFDVPGIINASWRNLISMGSKRPVGASTITQQVAKNFLTGRRQSLRRKLEEFIMALRLEFCLPKSRILELYLNEIYLGNRSYGVAYAAYAYFRKPLNGLSLNECALLAALPKAPGAMSRERLYLRGRWVLRRMFDDGHIGREEYYSALKNMPQLHACPDYGGSDFFNETVRRELLRRFGAERVHRGGLHVRTALSPFLQRVISLRLERFLADHERDNPPPQDGATQGERQRLTGGIVIVHAKTGAVLAMTGGRMREAGGFNYVTQAWRQGGSTVKPFIYLHALMQGISPLARLSDESLTITVGNGETYRPRGSMPEGSTARFALSQGLIRSLNAMTVRLLMLAGLDGLPELTRDIGLYPRMKPYLANALGSQETSLLRLTNAYCGFFNGGIAVSPLFYHGVYDARGLLCYSGEEASAKPWRADEAQRLQVKDWLHRVISEGTADKLAYLEDKYGLTLYGKTGTTNDNKDALFVGAADCGAGHGRAAHQLGVGQLTAQDGEDGVIIGIALGYPVPRSMGSNGTGAKMAAPLFAAVIEDIFDNLRL